MMRYIQYVWLALFLPNLSFGAIDLDVDKNGATDVNRGGTNATTAANARTALGLGTTDNPSWLSAHASGGNLAAANAQVTKKWITGLPYVANLTSVIYGGKHYICISSHTAGSTTEPGVGASWATVWAESGGAGDDLGDATATDIAALFSAGGDYLKADGSTGTPAGGDGITHATSDGNYYASKDGAWVDLAPTFVQLNASSQLPAVSADLLTVTDTGTYFTTDTVGAALQELGSELAGVTEITLDANTLAITDGVLSVIGGGTGTGGYLATPPTYSDEACTPGQYALSESYRWDCVATGNWNRTALTDWSNPAPVPPTLTSATVGTAGLYADLLFSETVEIGTGGNGGWSMSCATTGAISMTYSSGATTNTLAYSLSDTPIQGETCTVAYTQPTDGIEAVDDGTDLATISSAAVTNNSTVNSTVGEWAIEDDFSANTIANYTEFSETGGTPTIGSGVLYNSANNGSTSYLYHNAVDLGSSSQVVEAVITVGSESGRSSGLIIRSNGTTGHYCYPDQGSNRFTCLGGTSIFKGWTAGAWALSTSHRTRISVGADNIYKFEVDFNDDGDYLDANEQVGNSTANASFSGTRAGVGFRSAYNTEIVDDFKAKVYAP